MTGDTAATGPLTHGIAARPAPGESESGDRAVIADVGGDVLVSVIDGLGHGPAAATAATSAATVLTRHAGEEVTDLLRRCHRELRHTRGAAVSLARIAAAAGSLQWVAVGNVQGAVVPAAGGKTTRLVTRGGVVGMRLPQLRVTTTPVCRGDLIVLFTDGVANAALHDLPRPGQPQAIADQLLDRHADGRDDGLVLVARYTGGQQ